MNPQLENPRNNPINTAITTDITDSIKQGGPKSQTGIVKKKVGSQNFNTLVESIHSNPGGFTLRVDGTPVKKGYAYSPYKQRELRVKKDDLTGEMLEKYYKDNVDLLGEDGNYFGGWLNNNFGNG